MIIDRIELHNFKRFREQEIRFKDGITGILGNNGTGKSSIVEAIFFALYGVQATGISGDYIVSSFASPKEKCEVRLDFRIGGDSYTVVRSFKKGKSVQHDAEFFVNNKLRAKTVSQVETEVRRVLGMGPMDFKNTVYAAQKDLLTLLENTPGKRKEWFLRALGIDYLKAGSDTILKSRADEKDRDLQLSEGELKGLSGRLDPEEQKSLLASVETCEALLRDLTAKRDMQVKKRTGAASDLQKFLDKKTEFTRLSERQGAMAKEVKGLHAQQGQVIDQITGLAGIEGEYHALEPIIATLDGKKRQLDGLRTMKSDAERLNAELRYAGKEVEDLKGRADKAWTKVDALEKDADRLAALRSGIRDLFGFGQEIPDSDLDYTVAAREAEVLHSIGTLSARIDQLVAERKKLVNDWNTIRDAGADGECPLCHQKLGTHFTEIEGEFSARLEGIEDEALKVCEDQERATDDKDRIASQKPALKEMRGISERLKQKEIFENELRDLTAKIREKESLQQSLATGLKELGYDEALFLRAVAEVADLEKAHRRYVDLGKKIAQGTVLRSQVAALDAQIRQKQGELAGINDLVVRSAIDPAVEKMLENAVAAIDSAIRTIDTETATTRERLKHTREKIALYMKEEEKIAGLRQKVSGLKEELDLLRLTRSIINEYVVYLMQVVRSRIEGEVSRIIDEITGGRYAQVLLDEDFNLLVRDVDDDYAIDRFSGGEQDDIAVALRIALSRYLAELHQVRESTLLIFDEIFGSQDEERRTNLLTALRTQESRFPQIILISHISEIQGEFSNTLMVEMGTDMSSRVREVA